jgi:ankyrin repeat protein
MPQPSDIEIETALKARDVVTLVRLLDKGLDANRTSAGGNSLLHAAARLGDISLVDKLLEKGANPLARNDRDETPWETAAAWGNTGAAQKIAARLPEGAPAARNNNEPIPYASLEEIRQKSAATGQSEFHALARQGRFAQVLVLAGKENLTAADLLERGKDGDTVLMTICQQGQLPLLVKAELWVKQPQEFQALWDKVPAHYRKEVDYDAFVGQLRQAKLKSYGNIKLKLPKKER